MAAGPLAGGKHVVLDPQVRQRLGVVVANPFVGVVTDELLAGDLLDGVAERVITVVVVAELRLSRNLLGARVWPGTQEHNRAVAHVGDQSRT